MLDGAGSDFHPGRHVTRYDAALWLVRAFIRPSSGPGVAPRVSDLAAIGRERPAGFDALQSTGFLSPGEAATGSGDRLRGTVTRREAERVLRVLTSVLVSPPQVMCKPGTTAPRRYITISTPTADATIHYTYTFDGSEPATPTAQSLSFELRQNGVLQFVNPLDSDVDSRFYRLKAVAMRNGMATSAVREFTWTILRPQTGSFRGRLIHEATATSPSVWKINNPAEYYQANVYYIEGSQRGVVFDAGEYSYLRDNLKTYIDTIASKPYDLVVGHSHPDHAEQVYNFTSAGITMYVTEREKAAFMASARPDFQAAGSAAVAAPDGHQLDLGNVQTSLFHAPGHTNGLITLLVNQTGWVYASDHFGCNRPYTADTTQYAGMKVDRFLSLQRQLLADYVSRRDTITEVTNAHQDVAVGMACVETCFQRLIDEGDSATAPSIRGGISGNPTSPVRNSRMSKVGDMWRDRNWIAIGNPLGSGWDQPVDYLTAPTTAYPCGATIDYNAVDGYRKYSVLSNVELDGGTLVGVDVYWAPPANAVDNKLTDKFDPWTYAYTVRLASGADSVRITPTAMSNRITSMRVNGVPVAQGDGLTVDASIGGVITVDVVAPDGVTTSRYTFTMAS